MNNPNNCLYDYYRWGISSARPWIDELKSTVSKLLGGPSNQNRTKLKMFRLSQSILKGLSDTANHQTPHLASPWHFSPSTLITDLLPPS